MTCFVCHSCNETLVDRPVYVKDEKNFHEECYIVFAAHKCGICHQHILRDDQKYIKTKEKTYHLDCYVCCKCGKSLSKKRFHFDGEKRICQPCVTATRFLPVAERESVFSDAAGKSNAVSGDLSPAS